MGGGWLVWYDGVELKPGSGLEFKLWFGVFVEFSIV